MFFAIALAGCATQSRQLPSPQPTQAAAPRVLKPCPLPDVPPKEIASKPGYMQYVITVVDDSGAAVHGLKQAEFEVSVNGKDIPIDYFRDDQDTMPASLVVIVDSSGSMKKKFAATDKSKVQAVSASIRNASANLNACDELALVVFAHTFNPFSTKNSRASVAVPLTTDHQAVTNAADSITPWGQTPLYDSIELAERELTAARYPNRSIVLITDGMDDASVIHKEALLQEVANANVPIDIVGIGDETKDPHPFVLTLLGGSPGDAIDIGVLQEAASASQGHLWLVSTTADDSGDKLAAALTTASTAAGYAYTIGFVQPSGPPAKIFVKSGKHVYIHAHQETVATH